MSSKLVQYTGSVKGVNYSIDIPEGFAHMRVSSEDEWKPKGRREPSFSVSVSMVYPKTAADVDSTHITGKIVMREDVPGGVVAATSAYRLAYWIPLGPLQALECTAAHLSRPSKKMRELMKKVCLTMRKR